MRFTELTSASALNFIEFSLSFHRISHKQWLKLRSAPMRTDLEFTVYYLILVLIILNYWTDHDARNALLSLTCPTYTSCCISTLPYPSPPCYPPCGVSITTHSHTPTTCTLRDPTSTPPPRAQLPSPPPLKVEEIWSPQSRFTHSISYRTVAASCSCSCSLQLITLGGSAAPMAKPCPSTTPSPAPPAAVAATTTTIAPTSATIAPTAVPIPSSAFIL